MQDALQLCDVKVADEFSGDLLGGHSLALLEAAGGSLSRAALADGSTGELQSWAAAFATLHVGGAAGTAQSTPHTQPTGTAVKLQRHCWAALRHSFQAGRCCPPSKELTPPDLPRLCCTAGLAAEPGGARGVGALVCGTHQACGQVGGPAEAAELAFSPDARKALGLLQCLVCHFPFHLRPPCSAPIAQRIKAAALVGEAAAAAARAQADAIVARLTRLLGDGTALLLPTTPFAGEHLSQLAAACAAVC